MPDPGDAPAAPATPEALTSEDMAKYILASSSLLLRLSPRAFVMPMPWHPWLLDEMTPDQRVILECREKALRVLGDHPAAFRPGLRRPAHSPGSVAALDRREASRG